MNLQDPQTANGLFQLIVLVVGALSVGLFRGLIAAAETARKESASSRPALTAAVAQANANKRSTGELRAAEEARRDTWKQIYEDVANRLERANSTIGVLEFRIGQVEADCERHMAELTARLDQFMKGSGNE